MTYEQARAAYYRASENVMGIRPDVQAGRMTEQEYKKRVVTWKRACTILSREKKKAGVH